MSKNTSFFITFKFPEKIQMNLWFFFFGLLFFASCKKPLPASKHLEGVVFGTTFHISYTDASPRNFEQPIDSLFHLVNTSLSTYLPTSLISRVNAGDALVEVDTLFSEVFFKAARIYRETEGAFDPTIGVLVNAWGFGPEKPLQDLDALKVKELLPLVGFDQVQLQQRRVLKKHSKTYFDFNAIAKGFGVDVVARYLESQQISNYLVEIGGELRARGTNSEGLSWRIGIEKPNVDGSREKPLQDLDALKVKELLPLVGFDQVQLQQRRVLKKYSKTYFDFNAIAKGFGVDVVARYLESQQISNYLVEIGGELRARGTNSEGLSWRIGIEKPNVDGSRSLQKVIVLKNASMATSGNYRKYRIDAVTGEKYVHTLDAQTGYPAKRDLLSATVYAPIDCADADGYATAFMAMETTASTGLMPLPEKNTYTRSMPKQAIPPKEIC